MNKLRKISKEFGEPFIEVVKGFAAQGCSRTLVAGTLGMTRQTLQRYCERFDLDQYFLEQIDMRRECRPSGGKGWTKGEPRFSLRKPIEHNGFIWHPGEPTYFFLYAQQNNKPSLSTTARP